MGSTATALGVGDGLVIVAYFAVIILVGVRAARFTRTTHEFFFAGQRFSWWLVAVSCVATLVGAYSFQQYSQIGFKYGLCSMDAYTNEWFILPLFLAGWLPIIYYSRVQSIPEYFERRFDRRTRIAVMVVLLVYLEVYIGINLLTIGTILDAIYRLPLVTWLGGSMFQDAVSTTDLSIFVWAAISAVACGIYLHAGGQTSVIMTDLLQGLLLLMVGLGITALALVEVGGLARFWEGLPATHRLPFAQFNHPAGLHQVGNFWSDAMVGTFAFYLINQGILMRFLAAKSVRESRRAMLVVVLILMPLAAVAVSGAGWMGRSLESHGTLEHGALADDLVGDNVFVLVARQVSTIPGMFGLVVAAVIAALMSTLDSYITAVSAVVVNDIWRPLRPGRSDADDLSAARFAAIVSTVLGLGMIFVGRRFDSIYQALSNFTSAILPPLVVVVFLAMLTRRFTARAAFWTLVLGSAAIALSMIEPRVIVPFAHGSPPFEPPGNPPGFEQFSYMRALFGLVSSSLIAVAFILFDGSPSAKPLSGLLISTLDEARQRFKGGVPNDRAIGRKCVLPMRVDAALSSEIRLPRDVMEQLQAEPGDLLYVSDARWWLGGFRSLHVRAAAPAETDGQLHIGPGAIEQGHLLADHPVRVEKIM